MSADGGQIDYPALLKQGYLQLKAMRERVERIERGRSEPIAIVGMGCRFPGGGNSPDGFWAMLRDGVDATRDVPADRWDIDAYYDPDPDRPGKMYVKRGAFLDDVDKFDAGFFNISPRECASLDPQQRLLLEVAWEAIEDAGIGRDELAGRPAGVYVGAMFHDYAHLIASAGLQHVDTYFGTGNGIAFMAGRLSYHLGLQGPSLVLDTACSSSLVAVHLACQSLRTGETDLGVACGVNLILSPLSSVVMCRLRALAPDGRCKTFDAAADGYARGEGCGVVVLKRLSDAVAAGDRIWAVIRGSAVNQDGAGAGITVPNGLAQQAVIRKAIAEAKVEPARIGYIEAHGTGTRLGDPLELRALWSALRDGRDATVPLIVGSLKTNVGHMEGAAGIGSLIKTVLSLRNGRIPPHLHVRQLNPLIADEGIPLQIPHTLTAWPELGGPRVAGVSSFGMSGTNVHMIVEQAEAAEQITCDEPHRDHVLCLSARTASELREMAIRYRDLLQANTHLSFADVCFTAAMGRTHWPHRLAVIADRAEAGALKLAAWLEGRDDVHGDVHARQIAEAYVGGESIDWIRVYAEHRYSKVSLPTYPFNRQRYWADLPVNSPEHAASTLQEIDALLYEVKWHPRKLSGSIGDPPLAKEFLLFADGGDVAERLACELEQRGGRCTSLYSPLAVSQAGGVKRPTVSTPEEFESAVGSAVLRANGRQLEIVYLWDLDLGNTLDAQSLSDAENIVAPGLLHLMQAVARVASGSALRLWVATRGVHAVETPQECRRPAGACLWGLGKVFGLEHPERWGGSIDLTAVASPDDARCVASDLMAADREDQIAYRSGLRYVARLEPGKIAPSELQMVCDASGVYWITGGLGALGLQTADWLVDRGARCLVLQSRRGLPPRDCWEFALTDASDVGAMIEAVRGLESRGAQVHVLAADVAHPAFLPQARQLLTNIGHPLQAIFHAAGVSALRSIAEMTAAELRSVLAAKVIGTWHLHELTRDFPAAKLVFFSSIASVWGSRLLAHYAAANQFLDSFASYRQGQGRPSLSVNWGPLQGGGMDLDREEERLGRVGIRPIAMPRFRALFDQLMQSSVCSVTAADVHWDVFKPLYEAQRPRPLVEFIKLGEQSTGERTSYAELDEMRALTGDDRLRSAEAFLLAQTAAVLKTRRDQLDVAEPLTALGVDSLMAMEVQKHVLARLGVAVPVAEFLQGASIRQLARTIAAGLNGKAATEGRAGATAEVVEGEL